MTTSTYKVGPGTLELGTGPLMVEAQFSNFVVQAAESVKSTDDLDLLDGSTLDGDANASFDWTATGNVVQDDLSDSGLVAWSWDEQGHRPTVYLRAPLRPRPPNLGHPATGPHFGGWGCENPGHVQHHLADRR